MSIRVDPLTGLKVLVGDVAPDAPEPEPEAHRDLFAAAPARGTRTALPGLDALLDWREAMRAAPAATAYLHATGTAEGGELWALEFVPAAVARERERFGAYEVRTMGANLLGDYVQEEVRRRARLVAYDDEAVALVPWAAQVAHQVLIAPRDPRPRWEQDGPSGAALLADVLARLHRLGAPAPRAWVRTAPAGAAGFCWHLDVVPGGLVPGPLETGTGVAHCPLAPEESAAALRGAA